MKTTIELPDDLFAEAKASAARRRTTLKAIVEHALRRELGGISPSAGSSGHFRINDNGMPELTAKKQAVTSQDVHRIMEELGI